MKASANTIESLEQRRLLSVTPVTLATVPGSVSSQLAVDSAGDVFGTTPGSLDSDGTIFEIAAGSAVVNTLANFGSTGSVSALGFSPNSIVVDSAGDLFGTATSDTNSGLSSFTLYDSEIWELKAGSTTIEVLSTIDPEAGITSIDSAADLLGTGVYDIEDATATYAFRYSQAGGFETIASSFGTEGNAPTVIGSDAIGDTYVLSQNEGTTPDFIADDVSEFSPSGSTLQTLHPLGAAPATSLTALAVDSVGDLFVGGAKTNSKPEIVEVKAGTTTAVLVGKLNQQPSVSVGGFVADSYGDLFAVESIGSGASEVDSIVEQTWGLSGLRTVAGFGAGKQISGLATDAKGDLFCTDRKNIYELAGVGTPALDLSPVSGQTSGVNPSITASTIPSSLVNGVRFTGVVRVKLTPLAGGAAIGTVTTRLYAVSASGDSLPLGVISQRHTAGSMIATLHLSTVLPTGSYNLVAQSVDAAGKSVVSSPGETIAVNAPYTQVSATVVAITPTVRPGGHGYVSLALLNTGNIDATGSLSITLDVPTDFPLLTRVLQLTISNNRKARVVRLQFSVPADAAAMMYDPVVTAVDDGVTNISASKKSFRVT